MVGSNLSWASFGDRDLKNLFKISPVFGFHAGGHIAFKVRKRFFLHTSILYSAKGFNMKGIADSYEIEEDIGALKIRYNYIDMPIVYTTYFKGDVGTRSFKYSLGIGPNISYWLGGKGEIENDDTHEFAREALTKFKIVFGKNPDEATENEMVVEKPTRIQLGLNITAGLMFEPAADREVVLTVRYEWGHSFLSRTSVGSFGPTATYFELPLQIKNQGLRISAAYLIDLKVENRKKGKSTSDQKKKKRK